jgi:hypothetical protein
MMVTRSKRRVDDSPRLSKRNNAFFLFGKAMAAWARLEAGLYAWFEHVENMDMRQAKPLYYAVNSFKGRLDLIRAAIETVHVEEIEQAFIESAMNLAVQYNGFRNKLAHGEFTLDGLIIEGKHADHHKALEAAISHEKLQTYSDRFNVLANLLWQARDLALGFIDDIEPDASVEKCQQQVIELLRQVQAEKRIQSAAKRRDR